MCHVTIRSQIIFPISELSFVSSHNNVAVGTLVRGILECSFFIQLYLMIFNDTMRVHANHPLLSHVTTVAMCNAIHVEKLPCSGIEPKIY